jgi:hypothetical protein
VIAMNSLRVDLSEGDIEPPIEREHYLKIVI